MKIMIINDSVILFALRNVVNDAYEESFLSENLTVFTDVLYNMLLETGIKYLPQYLKTPEDYEVMSVADVVFSSKEVKADWKSCGILKDLLDEKEKK